MYKTPKCDKFLKVFKGDSLIAMYYLQKLHFLITCFIFSIAFMLCLC